MRNRNDIHGCRIRKRNFCGRVTVHDREGKRSGYILEQGVIFKPCQFYTRVYNLASFNLYSVHRHQSWFELNTHCKSVWILIFSMFALSNHAHLLRTIIVPSTPTERSCGLYWNSAELQLYDTVGTHTFLNSELSFYPGCKTRPV